MQALEIGSRQTTIEPILSSDHTMGNFACFSKLLAVALNTTQMSIFYLHIYFTNRIATTTQEADADVSYQTLGSSITKPHKRPEWGRL